MKRLVISVLMLATATVVAWPSVLTAQRRTRITLASPAPVGSVWDIELKLLADDWRRLSNGSVDLRVASAGRAGTECSVITPIRAGTRPEAAVLTTGLTCLDRSFAVTSVPFFFESLEEAFAVVEQLEPTFASRIEPQGVTLLSWGFGGWVHVFSRERISGLEDLKSAKLFTTAGDNAAGNWYRSNGFHPVPLALTDTIASLMNGSIDAMPTPPYGALAFEYYRETKYMLDVPIAPLVGALVINTDTWNSIAADLRPKLIEAARAMGGRLRTSIPTQDREAVTEMVSRGLELVTPDAGFRETSDPLIESMRGTWVPDDIYNLALKARAAYRAQGR